MLKNWQRILISTKGSRPIGDHIDGDKVYSEKTTSTDVSSMTLKVPRKNNLEVRLSCQVKDPNTGEESEREEE